MTLADDIAEDMEERCEFVFIVEPAAEPEAGAAERLAFGAVLVGPTDAILAVEVGLGETGAPFMTLRSMDAEGGPVEPSMIANAESVMVMP